MSQIASDTAIPHIQLHGTHREIGLQHGRILKDRIAAALALYVPYFKRSNEEIKQWSLRARKSLEYICPHIIEEIDAIAEASEQDPHLIMALNIRTELMGLRHKAPPSPAPKEHECTTLYFPNQNIIGQNWDWAYCFRNNAVLLDVTLETGHRFLTLTEPGIVAKVGMSSSRIATTMTRLVKAPVRFHEHFLPIHILLRLALESRSIDEIEKLVSSFNGGAVGTASTAIVGSASVSNGYPRYLAMELANEETFFLFRSLEDAPCLSGDPQNRVIFHTNHFIAEKAGQIDAGIHNKSSHIRYARLLSFVSAQYDRKQVCDIAMMKKILGDAEDPEEPICRAFRGNEGNFEIGSISTIIMDLNTLEMHITMGPPLKTAFSTFGLLNASSL